MNIIVIGAGTSGLTAGNLLHTAGHDVIVLEARDWVGGRTRTVESGEGHFDLGAAWVHGLAGNPLVELFQALDVELVRTSVFGDQTPVIETSGRRWGQAELSELVTAWERFDGAEYERRLGPDASVRDAVDQFVVDASLSATAERAARFVIEDLECGLSIASSSAEASAHGYGYYEELDDADAVPRSGYGRLVEALAEPLDIRTNEVVTAVDWSASSVMVQSSSGPRVADHIVLSAPLGVLKAGAIEFLPGLPEDKLEAIGALAMADLRKVIFSFDEPHWPDEKYWLHYSEPPGDFPLIVDFTPIRGHPILEIEYGGRSPSAGLPESEIERRALRVLRTIFGHGLPDPSAVAHSQWHRDPFSRGSYSYLPVGARASHMDTLGAPVGPVHFAGEATVPRFYGTVHAAYLSGLRAAREIGGPDLRLSFAPAFSVPDDVGAAGQR